MEKRIVKTYTEVKLDETIFEKTYKNPLTRVFQYEYALYEALAKQFAKVECRSMCIDNMKMYFKELPLKEQNDNGQDTINGNRDTEVIENAEAKHSRKTSQEKMITMMENLISRDVLGKIEFPMMSRCAAEVSTLRNEDGSHWMIFSDGIYGFALRLVMNMKGKVRSIEVRALS